MCINILLTSNAGFSLEIAIVAKFSVEFRTEERKKRSKTKNNLILYKF